MSHNRDQLVQHLRKHALRIDGPFTLRSGVVSGWYLDARQTTFDGEGGLLVGAAVVDALDADVTAVGGMTMGADPVALAAAMAATATGRQLRAFSVRKETKDHGTRGRLVGPVDRGDHIAVIDDTTTTGGALVEALDVLADAGLTVVQAVTLVDRSGGTVRELMTARGVPYVPIVTPEDLGVER